MHIKIKSRDGETVEMHDDLDEAQERLEELESNDEVGDDNLHIVDFS